MREAFVRPTDTMFDAYPFTFFPLMPFVFGFFLSTYRKSSLLFFNPLMECRVIVVLQCQCVHSQRNVRRRTKTTQSNMKKTADAQRMPEWNTIFTINENDVIVTSTRTTR